MSIRSQINRIKQAKNNLRNSILSKGVNVPENSLIDNYSSYVDQILQQGHYTHLQAVPTKETQTILPAPRFDAFDEVTIQGDNNFVASNIKEGVEIWGVIGTYIDMDVQHMPYYLLVCDDDGNAWAVNNYDRVKYTPYEIDVDGNLWVIQDDQDTAEYYITEDMELEVYINDGTN